MIQQSPELSYDLTTADGAAELEDRVRRRLGAQVREFRVVVLERGLILRGRTHNYFSKQLAQEAVMRATTLPILANEIEVS